MKFSYNARSVNGDRASGEMEAVSENELKTKLAERDLILESVQVIANATTNQKIKTGWFKKVSNIDKIFFAQNLQVMVRSGLSMSTALKTLTEQTNNKLLKQILTDINEHVTRGVTLSDALANYPKVFSELFVNMVRAGEKSGKLEEVLIQITNQLRKSHTLVAKVRGALTYPIIVVVAMIGIAIGMITFIIPKIIGIFEEFNATLPLPTRILINVSKFVTSNGPWLIIAAVFIIWGFIKFIHAPSGRRLWHSLLLKTPVLSPILQKINLAKFCRTFSSLIKTDIPIVQAFEITATTLGNVIYRQAVNDMGQRVRKGVQIASILPEYPKLFPPLVIQMVTVGEDTGSLDNILEELSGFYEEEVDRTMSNLSTIIEPLLMLLLGVGVGAMAVAIILPMYSLTQNV
ncbi:MAG: type II secretion system F family protein [Candidatus Kerfeldbacteria bacterium]|nr:type II secretion system F family protein [Candidatus Kerfeldbacteria bacterium]